MSAKTEVWLRGPLDNVPALLQPVAHALLQAREEVEELMADFPGELLWKKPAGAASPGFHLQHMAGVLDRLFTYAKNGSLDEGQFHALEAEGKPNEYSVADLITAYRIKVDEALIQLREVDKATLTEERGVGRSKLPSTVIGLYVHAAEHTMRHLGQLLVTVKVLKAST
jgi:hypothetical protein